MAPNHTPATPLFPRHDPASVLCCRHPLDLSDQFAAHRFRSRSRSPPGGAQASDRLQQAASLEAQNGELRRELQESREHLRALQDTTTPRNASLGPHAGFGVGGGAADSSAGGSDDPFAGMGDMGGFLSTPGGGADEGDSGLSLAAELGGFRGGFSTSPATKGGSLADELAGGSVATPDPRAGGAGGASTPQTGGSQGAGGGSMLGAWDKALGGVKDLTPSKWKLWGALSARACACAVRGSVEWSRMRALARAAFAARAAAPRLSMGTHAVNPRTPPILAHRLARARAGVGGRTPRRSRPPSRWGTCSPRWPPPQGRTSAA